MTINCKNFTLDSQSENYPITSALYVASDTFIQMEIDIQSQIQVSDGADELVAQARLGTNRKKKS